MFEKHAIQLKVVKTPNPTPNTEERTPFMSSDEFQNYVKPMLKDVAVAVVAVMAVSVVLNTASQLVINAMESNSEK